MAPDVLPEAIKAGRFRLTITLPTDRFQHACPTRILTLSPDPYERNLAIGQVIAGRHLRRLRPAGERTAYRAHGGHVG